MHFPLALLCSTVCSFSFCFRESGSGYGEIYIFSRTHEKADLSIPQFCTVVGSVLVSLLWIG